MNDVAIQFIALAGVVHIVLGVVALARRSRSRATAIGLLAIGVVAVVGASFVATIPSYAYDCAQWTPECAADNAAAALRPIPAIITTVVVATVMVVAALVLAIRSRANALPVAILQGVLPLLGIAVFATGA